MLKAYIRYVLGITLLNDVFCYFVHNLTKLQNMHQYKITRDTHIKALMCTTYCALAGPPSVPDTYLFSKGLVAYLETLIVFSVYYRADDPSMSGKMDQFYTKALALYKDYPYSEFHKYTVSVTRSFFSGDLIIFFWNLT